MFRPSTSRNFNGRINVAFINITSYTILQQRPAPTPRHTIFAFLISTLLSFLELHFQNTGTVSPFQTNPKTMWIALFSMLLYCVAYEVEPRFIQVGRGGMGLFGSILSISLASVLFHNYVSRALYFLYVLFRLGRCCAVESKCFGAGYISKLLQIFFGQYAQPTGGGSQLPSLPTGESFSHFKKCGCN